MILISIRLGGTPLPIHSGRGWIKEVTIRGDRGEQRVHRPLVPGFLAKQEMMLISRKKGFGEVRGVGLSQDEACESRMGDALTNQQECAVVMGQFCEPRSRDRESRLGELEEWEPQGQGWLTKGSRQTSSTAQKMGSGTRGGPGFGWDLEGHLHFQFIRNEVQFSDGVWRQDSLVRDV